MKDDLFVEMDKEKEIVNRPMNGAVDKYDDSSRDSQTEDKKGSNEVDARQYKMHDAETLARLLWKIDFHVIPMVTMLYFFSFLDRTSIGNARLGGLQTDLKMSNGQYNVALSVLFVSYVSFEIPSNLILKRFRPSIYLPTLMFIWGTVMTLTGIVQSFGGLVACRVFLGFFEAGLFPGVIFYLSLWYPRHKVILRVAIFFSAATLAGAFGGLIATGVMKMQGIAGLQGWRWLFIIEGLMTVVGSWIAYAFLADFPETARFLTSDEREIWARHLKADWSGESIHRGLDWAQVRLAFCDYVCPLQFQVPKLKKCRKCTYLLWFA